MAARSNTPLIIGLLAGLNLLRAQAPEDPFPAVQERLKRHDLMGAADLLQKAAAQNPESPRILTALGQIDYLRGDFTEAEMDFKHALKVDDKFARAWVGLGKVFEAASLREKAKVCYRNAWQQNPGDPEVQRYYARTLSASEQLAGLENYLANAGANEDPDNIDQARRQAEQLKWLGNREAFGLTSPLEHTEIKLSALLADTRRVHGFALPVSFNGGKTLHLQFDSGAGGIVLNQKAATAAGLRKIADLKFWGIGSEGDRTGYTELAESVNIGSVSFRNCPVAVSDKKFLDGEDGLVGADVFARFLVTIDLQERVVKLDPLPAHKTLRPDPNWQDREVSPEFSTYTPFWRVGKDILLSTRVNGAKPVLFLIDTGSYTSLIDPDYASQFTGVRSEDLVRMRGISGKVPKVQSAENLIFEFGHYRQPVRGVLAIPLERVMRNSPQITGIFGVTSLIDFRMKIDYRDGLINLEYVGPKY